MMEIIQRRDTGNEREGTGFGVRACVHACKRGPGEDVCVCVCRGRLSEGSGGGVGGGTRKFKMTGRNHGVDRR